MIGYPREQRPLVLHPLLFVMLAQYVARRRREVQTGGFDSGQGPQQSKSKRREKGG